jgi:PAS domain S-box-containing protein
VASQASRGSAARTNTRRNPAAAKRFLAEASELVFGSLDYETTLVSLARLTVPFLADWCMVDVLEADGSIRRIAEAHVDPKRAPLLRRLEQEYPPRRDEKRGIAGVLRSGTTIYNADVSDEILNAVAKDAEHLELLKTLGFASHISVPLTARGRALGVISFVRGADAPRHTPADVSLAEELAMRAAVAVDNARLFRVEQEARRLAVLNAERTARLQTVTAALAEARTTARVAEIAVEQCVAALSARGGIVSLCSEDGAALEMAHACGYPEQLVNAWRRFPLRPGVPLVDAALQGSILVLESPREIIQHYPAIARQGERGGMADHLAIVAIPLVVDERLLGALAFTFPEVRHVPDDERAFMSTLANQCAQALERVRLHGSEQAATRRYHDLVQNLEAIVWEMDVVAGRITFISNRSEQMLGYPLGVVYEHPELWVSFIHPDDRPWVIEAYTAAIAAGVTESFEYRMQRADGEYIWVRDQLSVVTDRDGKPMRLLGVTLDVTARREAEAAREAGEARFRALVQNSSDMIFVVERATGVMLYTSPSVTRILGWPADQLAGDQWRKWINPEDLLTVSTTFRDASAGSPTVGPFECRLRHQDGSWRYIESMATDLSDEAGIAGWVVNSRDITERKQVESVLYDSERWWRALTQNATDVTVLLNDQAEVQWVSAPAERILGYEPEVMLGVNAFELIHPDDQAHCLTSFGGVLQTPGTHPPLELRIRHADGTWRWFETRANNLLNEPIVGAVVQNLRDITSRKEREEERALLAAIVETSEDAIIGNTLDGSITSWNSGAERIYGYTADEAVGKSISLLALPEQDDEVFEILDQLRAGESISHFETRLRRKDGAVIDVSLAASPVRDGAGNVIAASAIARDITDQKRLAARLAQAERLSSVGELAAGVAHEVNNPLAAISLTAELALRQELSPALHDDLTLIRHEAGRAGDIVRALLRFARHREPALEPIQMGEIIEEALSLLADRLTRHRIELIRDIVPAPDTLGDRDQVLQVLINLLTNAVDAMKREGCGQLRVRLTSSEDQVELALTDSGDGIPDDMVARIFDPFFTTKAPGEGTGLGLSISHRIIADHNGALTAVNDPDGGACFRISLPIMQRTATPSSDATIGARVIILHRDRLAAEMHAEAVSLLGYVPSISCTEVQDWSNILDTNVMAVMAGPGLECELGRLGASAPRPRLVLIGSTPAWQTSMEWDALLPERYKLDDLKQALEGLHA